MAVPGRDPPACSNCDSRHGVRPIHVHFRFARRCTVVQGKFRRRTFGARLEQDGQLNPASRSGCRHVLESLGSSFVFSPERGDSYFEGPSAFGRRRSRRQSFPGDLPGIARPKERAEGAQAEVQRAAWRGIRCPDLYLTRKKFAVFWNFTCLTISIRLSKHTKFAVFGNFHDITIPWIRAL